MKNTAILITCFNRKEKTLNCLKQIYDLDISDEHGNVVLEIGDGHLRTKNFDSRDIKQVELEYEESLADVYCIPCYGQSLAINAEAGVSTFSYIEPLEVDASLNSRYLQDMCSGTVESFRFIYAAGSSPTV